MQATSPSGGQLGIDRLLRQRVVEAIGIPTNLTNESCAGRLVKRVLDLPLGLLRDGQEVVEDECLAQRTRLPKHLLRLVGQTAQSLHYDRPHTVWHLDLVDRAAIPLPVALKDITPLD